MRTGELLPRHENVRKTSMYCASGTEYARQDAKTDTGRGQTLYHSPKVGKAVINLIIIFIFLVVNLVKFVNNE